MKQILIKKHGRLFCVIIASNIFFNNLCKKHFNMNHCEETMDENNSRSSLRDRILLDLRNIVKQIYHESVYNELSANNKTYICLILIKNLDEALRHGLKQLHLGYWKPMCEIIHPETLQSVENLKTFDASECNALMKGRAWIALALKDDSFISYIQCLVTQSDLEKFYEDWSILRCSDACNKFLSVLSGLDNIIFSFEVEYLNKPPNMCHFGVKTNEEKKILPLDLGGSKSSINLTTSSSSLTSPVDSGVHTQGSTSDVEHLLDDKQADMDFLNGNIPETVLLRKNKKDTKRHVSFHEDIIYKSPEKCRKLKWDSENLRYSWSGEQIDSSILKEVDFNDIKNHSNKNSTPVKPLDINERGTPEGEETPFKNENSKQSNKYQKSIIVKRFLQSIKKQSKINQLCKKYKNENHSFHKIKIDSNLIAEINNQVKKELECKEKTITSSHEIILNEDVVKEMVRNQSIYKTYKLRDYLFLITNANIYLINRNLETKRISFKNLKRIIVYPDAHIFLIYELDEEFHVFVTGDSDLTNEILGRLEWSMRKNQFNPPEFTMLDHDNLRFLKQALIDKLAIDKKEKLLYCGTIQVDKENDLLNSVLPTTKRGFLMYRDQRAGDSWIPGDFCLKNGIFYLFGDDSSFPKMAINIATGCQSCNRTKNPDRPHTFQISLIEKELEIYSEANYLFNDSFLTPKGSKSETQKLLSGFRQKLNKFLTFGGSRKNDCILEFAAANEYELCEWLQMIIQASCGESCEEAHKENLTDGILWLTSSTLIITNEFFWFNNDVDIISCAQLRDVAAFRIGESEKDFFTVIEFICMEASSTSGDWILYMNSRQELEKLKLTLQNLWKFNDKFPYQCMREGKLLKRCRKSQNSLLDNSWSALFQ